MHVVALFELVTFSFTNKSIHWREKNAYVSDSHSNNVTGATGAQELETHLFQTQFSARQCGVSVQICGKYLPFRELYQTVTHSSGYSAMITEKKTKCQKRRAPLQKKREKCQPKPLSPLRFLSVFLQNVKTSDFRGPMAIGPVNCDGVRCARTVEFQMRQTDLENVWYRPVVGDCLCEESHGAPFSLLSFAFRLLGPLSAVFMRACVRNWPSFRVIAQ